MAQPAFFKYGFSRLAWLIHLVPLMDVLVEEDASPLN